MSQLEEISELQELKEQFNLISEKLEQQVIINKTLIHESMNKKISYVDRTFKIYSILVIIATPIFLGLLLLHNAHWAVIIFALLSLLSEGVLYYTAFHKLNSNDLLMLGFVDAMGRVAKFKKRIKTITCIMLIPGIALFIIYVGLTTNFNFDINIVIFYAIFVSAAFIWELLRTKKMFRQLDGILAQIKEIRSAE
ncbi:MAG: hypothetical protein IKZ14_03220 [Muribaculaceae bacterium]|nr:hypothetical protein [Muribaculaceae bacterium]